MCIQNQIDYSHDDALARVQALVEKGASHETLKAYLISCLKGGVEEKKDIQGYPGTGRIFRASKDIPKEAQSLFRKMAWAMRA